MSTPFCQIDWRIWQGIIRSELEKRRSRIGSSPLRAEKPGLLVRVIIADPWHAFRIGTGCWLTSGFLPTRIIHPGTIQNVRTKHGDTGDATSGAATRQPDWAPGLAQDPPPRDGRVE